MKLKTIIDRLNLKVITDGCPLAGEVNGVYVSDLLSDVLARSRAGDLWVTLQVHPNIVAVAAVKELAGIILVNGRRPEPATLRKAEREKIPLLSSDETAFQVAGVLYQLMAGS
jgi:hypothetical protein